MLEVSVPLASLIQVDMLTHIDDELIKCLSIFVIVFGNIDKEIKFKGREEN